MRGSQAAQLSGGAAREPPSIQQEVSRPWLHTAPGTGSAVPRSGPLPVLEQALALIKGSTRSSQQTVTSARAHGDKMETLYNQMRAVFASVYSGIFPSVLHSACTISWFKKEVI